MTAQAPATAEIEKRLRVWFSTNFWLLVGVPKEKHRIPPESTPVFRIRSPLIHTVSCEAVWSNTFWDRKIHGWFCSHQRWSDCGFLPNRYYPVFEKLYPYPIRILFWLKSYYPYPKKTIWKCIMMHNIQACVVSLCPVRGTLAVSLLNSVSHLKLRITVSLIRVL